jgi:hypothetical protein
MDAPCTALTADGVADNPAHRIARRHVGQFLARLQRNGRDLFGTCIEPIERAFGPGIDLDGVDVAGAGRLDARGLVRLGDRLLRRDFFFSGAFTGERLQLPRQRQDLGHLHHRDRFRWFRLRQRALEGQIVIRR